MKNSISMTIGIDLGDQKSAICVLDADGNVVSAKSIPTTRKAFETFFAGYSPCLVAMEVGTHSRWVSAISAGLGFETLVANARKLQAITANIKKNDRNDAELLARLARSDRKLLSPVQHRSEDAQAALSLVRARDTLVRARTSLVACIRGIAKATGYRLPKCDADVFHKKIECSIPPVLMPAIGPLLAQIGALTEQIRKYDSKMAALVKHKYQDAQLLQQVPGVGPITALAFVLTIEDKSRFAKSRDVAAFFGLVPRQDQSGMSDKQLGITKAGCSYVRRLLVQCANYIMQKKSADSDLKQWGLQLAERGGANAKKRAKTAVARKLAVLLHRLWVTGEEYVPFGYAMNGRSTRAPVLEA